MRIGSLFALAALVATGIPAGGALRITEFLAAGGSSPTEVDLDSSDWIEIGNETDHPVNLEGFFLTDDIRHLQKWAFPAVVLAAGEYLVVLASGENRRDPAETLHTNFSLGREAGGYLGLIKPDGATIVSEFTEYPEQRAGFSYGVSGSDHLYYESPTPAEANSPSGRLGFVADTKFSMDRGFYDEAIEVEITTATEGAVIYYSTDGSLPGPGTPFSAGKRYSEPLTIDKTTTLRAVAHKQGYEPSNVDTHTYLFLNDVIRQTGEGLPDDWGNGEDGDYEMDPEVVDHSDYRDTIIEDFKTLPALSIVLDPDDFFSMSNGIYPGIIGLDGIDKPCSAELIQPEGTDGFQIDCAVRIVGQTSPDRWKIKKLSMRLRFDGEFGPPTLEYPLFDEPTAVTEFNTLTVDARHNNTWAYQGGSEPTEQRRRAQYLRDQFTADLQREMGGLAPHGRYVHTYVNGIYWGMYNLHERPDDAFNQSYHAGRREDWQVLRHGTVLVSGHNSMSDYSDLHNLARDAGSEETYRQIQEVLDVDDFIHYMLANFVTGNTDWGPKNYYVSRNPVIGEPWRYHSWDAEKGMQGLNDDAVTKNDIGGPTGLHQRLRASDDYRIRFADLVYKHLFNDGTLSPEGLRRIYKRRTDEIDRAVILESARWGDSANGVTRPYTRNEHWVAQRDYLMEDYFPRRVDIVFDQLERENLTGDLDPPEFGQRGGHVDEGFQVVLSKSVFAEGTIVYTIDGSDPRLEGGQLSENAIAYENPIPLGESTLVKARLYRSSIFGGAGWSALTEANFVVNATPPQPGDLLITKLNYRPGAVSEDEAAAGYSRTDFEFLELTNLGAQRIDLRGVKLTAGIRFAFEQAATQELDPGARVLVVEDLAAFTMRYGSEFPIAGEYDGNLSNDGEALTLTGANGELLSFTYNDEAEWPQEADGGGSFLILIDPSSQPDPDLAESWQASVPGSGIDGTGGAALTYADWRRAEFGDNTPDEVAGPEADPDYDGAINLAEFLMGGDPHDRLDAPRLEVTKDELGRAIFLLPRRIGVRDGAIFLETSRDLVEWSRLSDGELKDFGTSPRGSGFELQRYQVLQITREAPWTERFVRAVLTLDE